MNNTYTAHSQGDNTIEVGDLCFQSYPCKHYIRVNGHSRGMRGARAIVGIFLQRNIPVPQHFAYIQAADAEFEQLEQDTTIAEHDLSEILGFTQEQVIHMIKNHPDRLGDIFASGRLDVLDYTLNQIKGAPWKKWLTRTPQSEPMDHHLASAYLYGLKYYGRHTYSDQRMWKRIVENKHIDIIDQVLEYAESYNLQLDDFFKFLVRRGLYDEVKFILENNLLEAPKATCRKVNLSGNSHEMVQLIHRYAPPITN